MSSRTRRQIRRRGGTRRTALGTRAMVTAAVATRNAIQAASESTARVAAAKAETEAEAQQVHEATLAAKAAAHTVIEDCHNAIKEVDRLRTLDARNATQQSSTMAALLKRAVHAADMARRYANRAREASNRTSAAASAASKYAPTHNFNVFARFFATMPEAVVRLNAAAAADRERARSVAAAAKREAADARNAADIAASNSRKARQVFDDAMSALIEKWEKVARAAERTARRADTPDAAFAATQEAESALQTVEILTAAQLE